MFKHKWNCLGNKYVAYMAITNKLKSIFRRVENIESIIGNIKEILKKKFALQLFIDNNFTLSCNSI